MGKDPREVGSNQIEQGKDSWRDGKLLEDRMQRRNRSTSQGNASDHQIRNRPKVSRIKAWRSSKRQQKSRSPPGKRAWDLD